MFTHVKPGNSPYYILKGTTSRSQKVGLMRKQKAFTLVEIMISMAIFALASAGIIKGVAWVQTSARHASINSAVEGAIEGYIAQIRSLDYSTLQAAYDGRVVKDSNNNDVIQKELPTQYLTSDPDNAADVAIVAKTIHVGTATTRQIIVGYKDDPSTTQNDRVLPELINLEIAAAIQDSKTSSSTNPPLDYITVTLDYSWGPTTGLRGSKERNETASVIVVNPNF